MPIYEYRCLDCGRYQSVLVRTYADPTDLTCPRCNGTRLSKLVSRFAVLHSDESRLEQLADPSALGDLDEDDPKSVAKWARKMGEQVGEDLGDEFHEMVDRIEAGENPDEDGAGPGEDGFASDGLDSLD
ncbi:MAG TPA: zinc ribbon domain-containing protein [Chloroflexota bacterium]|nr:zinc ribbon domain-containing protein [Chloroflexota bacterium]